MDHGANGREVAARLDAWPLSLNGLPSPDNRYLGNAPRGTPSCQKRNHV